MNTEYINYAYTIYWVFEWTWLLKPVSSYTRLHEGARLFQDIPLPEGETISSIYGKFNDAKLARPLVYSRERAEEK